MTRCGEAPRPRRGEGDHRHAPHEQAGPQIQSKLKVYAGPSTRTPRSSRFRSRSSRWPSDRAGRDDENVSNDRGRRRGDRRGASSPLARPSAESPRSSRSRPRACPDRARPSRSRPSAAARRPSSACGSPPAPASSTLNGRTLEAYFPNKVHQQLIKAPLVTVDRAESFDIFAHLHGGGTVRPGRRPASGHRPRPDRGHARGPARR